MGSISPPLFPLVFHSLLFSFISSMQCFFEAPQVYNLIALSHISVVCGEQAEATGRCMVLVHSGPLMCFLSLKVQPYRKSQSSSLT